MRCELSCVVLCHMILHVVCALHDPGRVQVLCVKCHIDASLHISHDLHIWGESHDPARMMCHMILHV